MIRTVYLFIFSLMCLSFYSCKNTGRGSSTPIDSTNATGAPAATYGNDTSYPVYEGTGDTSLKTNTMSHDDSMQGRHLK